ncbi:SIMPL domain-containing protein [Halobacillus seohaensis]|uniref:SIMPL domain-containing protein n=1 Tax=Halobacillus seohaensis TaxID=447421 RepID=A0ABW2EPW4_9BACI
MYSQSIHQRVMTVSGSGEIKAQPTVAVIQLGVVTESQSLTQAQQENARVMNQVIESIVKLGLPREAIQTADYSISPQYDYDSGTQVFRGYQVMNMISVTIEDINQTGEVIDTAVQNGANQVSNIQFSVKNPEVLYQRALSEALNDAYMKARSMARTMGLQLEPTPVKVIERMQGGGIPLAKAETFAAATPIEPGQLEIRASVEVKFLFFS